ncbi:MAG: radical SAM protein [Candidatus Omnitrophica bacterium]|nr:radical SAM protein [Candidatus Omnitrophota bacterium]
MSESDKIQKISVRDVKIRANSNFHLIGGKNILDSEDPRFRKYRHEWVNNPGQFKVRDFPLHVDIEVTNLCNLRCPYCAATHDGWGKNAKGKLGFEVFRKIIDEGEKNDLYSVKFSLRGEPLLHEDLPRMVEYSGSKGIIDMYFNTNGVLLDEGMSRRLIDAGLNRISISCDGWDKESFEGNRVGAQFEQVLSNIRGLRKLRDKLGVDYPKIRIQPVMFPEIKEHWDEYLKLWQPLADEIGYVDPREEGPGVDHRGIKGGWACPFLWQRMIVLWDGTILPCLLHGVGDLSLMQMGNIQDTTIKEQWLSDKLSFLRNKHMSGESHLIEACDRCSYRASEIRKSGGVI